MNDPHTSKHIHFWETDCHYSLVAFNMLKEILILKLPHLLWQFLLLAHGHGFIILTRHIYDFLEIDVFEKKNKCDTEFIFFFCYFV